MGLGQVKDLNKMGLGQVIRPKQIGFRAVKDLNKMGLGQVKDLNKMGLGQVIRPKQNGFRVGHKT